jgi:hypothetical protein
MGVWSILNIEWRADIIEGSVLNYTFRTIEAILTTITPQHLAWPTSEQRRISKEWFAEKDIPGGCIGIADGFMVVFDGKPARPDSQDFWCWKNNYGYNCLAIVNEEKRIIYLNVGQPGCQNDVAVYRETDIGSYPDLFFGADEYIIADSGYHSHPNLVSMYKPSEITGSDPDGSKVSNSFTLLQSIALTQQ